MKAKARMALAGCEMECPRSLLDQVRAPDLVLRVDQQQSDEEAAELVAKELDRLAGYPPMSKDHPWVLPHASRSFARSFSGTELKSSGLSRGSTLLRPSAPATQRHPVGGGYFSLPERSRSPVWAGLKVLLAILVVGALVLKFVFPESNPFGKSMPQQPVAEPADGAVPNTPGPGLPSRAQLASVVSDASAQQNANLVEPPVSDTGKDQAAASEDQDGAEILPEGYNRNWIGGACDSVGDCKYRDALCIRLSEGIGFCTRQCHWWCPDPAITKSTRIISRCVDIYDLRLLLPSIPELSPRWGRGFCMSQCNRKVFPESGCRRGLTCLQIPLRRRNYRVADMCVPGPIAAQRARKLEASRATQNKEEENE